MADNMNAYFKSLFATAHRKSFDSQFVEADDICHRLLSEPQLPLLYRAGCNLLLAFGDDNPVDFAKEAVYWYQEMYDEVKDHPVDGPHHKLLLEQAQDALENAEREAAEKDKQGDEGEGGGEPEREEEVDDDIEMVPESEAEKEEEPTALTSSMPTVAPSSSLIMGTASTAPTQYTQPTQVTTQEEKKTSSDEE